MSSLREIEMLGRDWETELAKSKIRGERLSIFDKDRNKNEKSNKEKENDDSHDESKN